MARLSTVMKIEIVTRLRDLAIDLVGNRGQLTVVKYGAGTITVMTYEDDRFAILYKTPDVDLSVANMPAWVNPKGFTIDIFFDDAKKMAVQWENDEPIDILVFKTGDWERIFEELPAFKLAASTAP